MTLTRLLWCGRCADWKRFEQLGETRTYVCLRCANSIRLPSLSCDEIAALARATLEPDPPR